MIYEILFAISKQGYLYLNDTLISKPGQTTSYLFIIAPKISFRRKNSDCLKQYVEE